MPLNKEQQNKLEKIISAVEAGDVGIAKLLFELEDRFDKKFEEELPNVYNILAKLKGDKGDNYVITDEDKKEIVSEILGSISIDKIASMASDKIDEERIAKKASKYIKPVIVDKVIEKTETIVEQPIHYETIKEVTNNVENKDTGEQIVGKINSQDTLIKAEKVEGLKDVRKNIKELQERPTTIIQGGGGGASGVRDIRGGTNVTVTKVNDIYTISATASGGASAFTDLTDTFASYTGLAGQGLRVNVGETGIDTYTPTDTDEKVKVSANDTTAGYLNGKLVAGAGITLTENNDGGDETITIDSTGSGVTTMGSFGSSPNGNGGSISGSTLTLQPADATNPGGVSTTTQSFLGTKTFLNTINYLNSSATANTVFDGEILNNSTAATSGNQQYSPALRFIGNGWKTNATAASQATEFRQYVVPVQGAAAPTANFITGYAVNGGAFSTVKTLTSVGQNLGVSGSASVPTWGFSAQTNYGMYHVNNWLRFSANALDSIGITSLGLVHIGILGIDSAALGVGNDKSGSYHVVRVRSHSAQSAAVMLFENSAAAERAHLSSSYFWRIADGSASAPAYSFVSDTDTGIYRVTANHMAFATGGTLRASINSSGTLTVGAGTVASIPSNTSSSFTPDFGSYTTSGSAGISTGVTDGTNNRRAGLFVNQTDAIWGLSHLYASGRIPFVMLSNTIEQLRVDTSHNLGVGTGATVSARIHAISTTEQLRLGYDSSDYLSVTVNSTGSATLNAVGSTPQFIFSDRVSTAKGADVASANDLTLGYGGNLFVITGTTTINAITTTGWQAGSEITLIFSGALTVKHNTAGGAGTAVMFLASSIDLTTAANTVLKLVYDGTQWQEVSRKIA